MVRVLSSGDIVGAIIDRPAVQCHRFAGNCGESALPAAWALNERPYIHAITVCAKTIIYGTHDLKLSNDMHFLRKF